MKFHETWLTGAFIIEPERREDMRGFFARTWCKQEFENAGLDAVVTQCGISFNVKNKTLRGMHYQAAPFEETKVVRCTMGAIYDVFIDLRPDSDTYLQWFSVELSAENRKMVYIPPGFAHGFLTLSDNTEVFYQISESYRPGKSRGVRWNDPAFNIQWPGDIRVISKKDESFPDFVVGA
jgi:dTDP-4-dehydrorhamnose 3,5-epimerase